jgi:hypothetical protein
MISTELIVLIVVGLLLGPVLRLAGLLNGRRL